MPKSKLKLNHLKTHANLLHANTYIVQKMEMLFVIERKHLNHEIKLVDNTCFCHVCETATDNLNQAMAWVE